MTDNGYVRAYRRAWHHPIFRDLLDGAVWNYLYQNAAWQDCRVVVNGTRVELKRGQMFVTYRSLGAGFCCAEPRIRRLINALQADAMIEALPTHRGTLVTICNYEQYQHFQNTADAPKATQPAHKPRAGDAPYKDKKTKEGNKTNTPPAPAPVHMPHVVIPPDWMDWAMEEKGWDESIVQDVWSNFRDYWVTGKGRTTKREDWEASWKNWCRKENIKPKGINNANAQGHAYGANRNPTKDDRARAAVMRAAERLGFAD